MTVVSDSSPLISLSRIGLLELLARIYHTVLITPEVYAEVVMAGKGLAGSLEVAGASWIDVRQIGSHAGFAGAPSRSIFFRTSLGLTGSC